MEDVYIHTLTTGIAACLQPVMCIFIMCILIMCMRRQVGEDCLSVTSW
jgi:hypothetical protein